MKTIDDGASAITIEYERATVRFTDHVPTSEKPPFVGVGQITRLPHGVALLSGFLGTISRSHAWMLLQALVADGFCVAYMDRMDGHAAPMAERVESGDFAGMWRVDLLQVRERRRVRQAAAEALP